MPASRLLVVAMAMALPACSLLARFEDNAAEQLGKAIKSYCDNTDAAYRERFRTIANEKIGPHRVAVDCATP